MLNIFGCVLPKYSSLPVKDSSYVQTKSIVRSLQLIGQNFVSSSGILISGPNGSGKSTLLFHLANLLNVPKEQIIPLYLGDQIESKSLLGGYVSSNTPGTFKYMDGILAKAMKMGAWVIIEDYHTLPMEIKCVFKPLLENKPIFIQSTNEYIYPSPGFKLFATSLDLSSFSASVFDNSMDSLWTSIQLSAYEDLDLADILLQKYPSLYSHSSLMITAFSNLNLATQRSNKKYSIRDLLKWGQRFDYSITRNSDNSLETLFFESLNVFTSHLPDSNEYLMICSLLTESLNVSQSLVEYYTQGYTPIIDDGRESSIKFGNFQLAISDRTQTSTNISNFAITRYTSINLEKIASSVYFNHPILLFGETGTGKTTMIQYLANLTNNNLIVVNMSQQSDSSDLLGGLKPSNLKNKAKNLLNIFNPLFQKDFPSLKNKLFLDSLFRAFENLDWSKFVKCLKSAIQKAFHLIESQSSNSPRKILKLEEEAKTISSQEWKILYKLLVEFEDCITKLSFEFVIGLLPLAIENGSWILLDEINLALPEVILCLSGLLESAYSSMILVEKNDVESIKRHKGFRIFACMNPSTDVGKKDLAPSLRSRFTEIYIPTIESSIPDLNLFIESYLKGLIIDQKVRLEVVNDMSNFYLSMKRLQTDRAICDSSNSSPYYSLRSLARALMYAKSLASTYGIRRALYDGIMLTFITQLDAPSRDISLPLIVKHITKGFIDIKCSSILKSSVKPPNLPVNNYGVYNIDVIDWLKIEPYWIPRGLETIDIKKIETYILTDSVRHNLLNLTRAVMYGNYPILLQGPTSSGKTSLINYLANLTGHKFLRINNHEQTDVQEYLGQYISNQNGIIVYQEGALVKALKNGYWIVLDELNLAPSDVLEALNRLLDDNRELLLTETGEIIKPHPHFRLFATQNPSGAQYGGRKPLSRAFRNRFVELAFDDLPQIELETILTKRALIPPSYSKKLVAIYKELKRKPILQNIMEKNSPPITLRDLFRWANRKPDSYLQLAEYGYMLLCERIRHPSQKLDVLSLIEKHLKVKVDTFDLYSKKKLNEIVLLINPQIDINKLSITWTHQMRRLFILMIISFHNKESVLFVGETGCGKTTVCQIYSEIKGVILKILNCHVNTETSDFIGSQRPARKSTNHIDLLLKLDSFMELNSITNIYPQSDMDDVARMDFLKNNKHKFVQDLLKDQLTEFLTIIEGLESSKLFEWQDGSLTEAFIKGGIFLLDEISLASDAVLERLNSVLEMPDKTLLLAEKGSNETLFANEEFNMVATMNPPGDHGKRELSPALRNRFTEIYTGSSHLVSDLKAIIFDKLITLPLSLKSSFSVKIVEFIQSLNGQLDHYIDCSLRDVVAYSEFINKIYYKFKVEPILSLCHAACLVYLDALSLKNQNISKVYSIRRSLLATLLKGFVDDSIIPDLTKRFYKDPKEHTKLSEYDLPEIINNGNEFGTVDFVISKYPESNQISEFMFNAPTTYENLNRILRAMQIDKPILIEGSPGAGKTTLIENLTLISGYNFIRVNLSEQTDIMDLLGTDLPTSISENSIGFQFKNGPLLEALISGSWLLLDEMNLANQTVLEGLNSILDHRQNIFIPELGLTFNKHPSFRFFAAQNPASQGGGRKNLPKSFLNRFTNVYFDDLSMSDLFFISSNRFTTIPHHILKLVIEFNTQLIGSSLFNNVKAGSVSVPNLRDMFRFLSLVPDDRFGFYDLYPAFQLIYLNRLSNVQLMNQCMTLFCKVFQFEQTEWKQSLEYSIDEKRVSIGELQYHKDRSVSIVGDYPNLQLLHYQIPYLKSLLYCIKHNWMPILISKIGAGKTSMIRLLAKLTGNNLIEFDINNSVDTNDLLGGLEISNNSSNLILMELKEEFIALLNQIISNCSLNYTLLAKLHSLLFSLRSCIASTLLALYQEFGILFDEVKKIIYQPMIISKLQKLNDGMTRIRQQKATTQVQFHWINGPLITAIEKGYWFHIRNSDQGPSSVLDRINSLIEPNGFLRLHERNCFQSSDELIHPHPNFRLFLSVNVASSGQDSLNLNMVKLSKALRNRGVEILILDSADSIQTSQMDLSKLQSMVSNNKSVIKNPNIFHSLYNSDAGLNLINSSLIPLSIVLQNHPILFEFMIDSAPLLHQDISSKNEVLELFLLSTTKNNTEFIQHYFNGSDQSSIMDIKLTIISFLDHPLVVYVHNYLSDFIRRFDIQFPFSALDLSFYTYLYQRFQSQCPDELVYYEDLVKKLRLLIEFIKLKHQLSTQTFDPLSAFSLIKLLKHNCAEFDNKVYDLIDFIPNINGRRDLINSLDNMIIFLLEYVDDCFVDVDCSSDKIQKLIDNVCLIFPVFSQRINFNKTGFIVHFLSLIIPKNKLITKLLMDLNFSKNLNFELAWFLFLVPNCIHSQSIYKLYKDYRNKLLEYQFHMDSNLITCIPISEWNDEISKSMELIENIMNRFYLLESKDEENQIQVLGLLDRSIDIIKNSWLTTELKESHHIYHFSMYTELFNSIPIKKVPSNNSLLMMSWDFKLANTELNIINNWFNQFWFIDHHYLGLNSFITNHALQYKRIYANIGLGDYETHLSNIDHLAKMDLTPHFDLANNWSFCWFAFVPMFNSLCSSSMELLSISNNINANITNESYDFLSMFQAIKYLLSESFHLIDIIDGFIELLQFTEKTKLFISYLWLLIGKLYLSYVEFDYPLDPSIKFELNLMTTNKNLTLYQSRLSASQLVASLNKRLDYNQRDAEFDCVVSQLQLEADATNKKVKPRLDGQIGNLFTELRKIKSILSDIVLDQIIDAIKRNHDLVRFRNDAQLKSNLLMQSIKEFQLLKTTYIDFYDLIIPIEFGFNNIKFGLHLFNHLLISNSKDDEMMSKLIMFLLQFPKITTVADFVQSETMVQIQTYCLQKPYQSNLLQLYSKLLHYLQNLLLFESKDYNIMNKLWSWSMGFYSTIKDCKKQLDLEHNSLYKNKFQSHNLLDENDDQLLELESKNWFPDYDHEFQLYKDNTITHKDLDHYLKEQKDREFEFLANQNVWIEQNNWSTLIGKANLYLFSKEFDVNQYWDELFNKSVDLASNFVDALGLNADKSIDDKLKLSNKMMMNMKNIEIWDDLWRIEPRSIYKNAYVDETRKLLKIVPLMLERVIEIHDEYTENETLNQLIHLINLILRLPIYQTPLMKYLAAIEALLTKAQNWELYACKSLSLSCYLSQLSGILIDWRRLELMSWNNLLVGVEQKFRNQSYDLWLTLLDSVLSCTKLDLSLCSSLFSTLFDFLSLCSCAEVETRLDMIIALEKVLSLHFQHLKLENEFHKMLLVSIRNLIESFSLFNQDIKIYLKNIKKPIEKELKDLVKLASWKDINLESLKHNSKKTHIRLCKIIRNYEKELKAPRSNYFVKFSSNFFDSLIPPLIDHRFDLQGIVCSDLFPRLKFGEYKINNKPLTQLYERLSKHTMNYQPQIANNGYHDLLFNFVKSNVDSLTEFSKVDWALEWNILIKEYEFEPLALQFHTPTTPKALLNKDQDALVEKQKCFVVKWNRLVKNQQMIRHNQIGSFIKQLKLAGIKPLSLNYFDTSFPSNTNWYQNTPILVSLPSDLDEINSKIQNINLLFYLAINRFSNLVTLTSTTNAQNKQNQTVKKELDSGLKNRCLEFCSRVNYLSYSARSELSNLVSVTNSLDSFISAFKPIDKDGCVVLSSDYSANIRYQMKRLSNLIALLFQYKQYIKLKDQHSTVDKIIDKFIKGIHSHINGFESQFGVIIQHRFIMKLIYLDCCIYLDDLFNSLRIQWASIQGYIQEEIFLISITQLLKFESSSYDDHQIELYSLLDDLILKVVKNVLMMVQKFIDLNALKMDLESIEELAPNQLLNIIELIQQTTKIIHNSDIEVQIQQIIIHLNSDFKIEALFCFIPFLKQLRCWLLKIINGTVQFQSLLGQLNLRFINTMICIQQNGLNTPGLLPDENDDNESEIEDQGSGNGGGQGAGIGEGKGDQNVNDEIETLEQILDDPLDQVQNEDLDNDKDDVQDLDNPDGFDAPLEDDTDDPDSDSQNSDPDNEKEHDDEMADLDDTLNDKLWDDEDQNQDGKDDDKQVDNHDHQKKGDQDLAANNQAHEDQLNPQKEEGEQQMDDKEVANEVPEDQVDQDEQLGLPDELDLGNQSDDELNIDDLDDQDENDQMEESKQDKDADNSKQEDIEVDEKDEQTENDEELSGKQMDIDDSQVDQNQEENEDEVNDTKTLDNEEDMMHNDDEVQTLNPSTAPSNDYTTDLNNKENQSNDVGQSSSNNRTKTENQQTDNAPAHSNNSNDDNEAQNGDNKNTELDSKRLLSDCIRDWKNQINSIESKHQKTQQTPIQEQDDSKQDEQNQDQLVKENRDGELFNDQLDTNNAQQFINGLDLENKEELFDQWGNALENQFKDSLFIEKLELDQQENQATLNQPDVPGLDQLMEDIEINSLRKDDQVGSNNLDLKPIDQLDWLPIEHTQDGPQSLYLDKTKQIWDDFTNNNQQYSSELSLQLKQILQTSNSTLTQLGNSKLKGFFKRGKRIYVKKLIQYIASNYRHDLFWLKRLPPPIRRLKLCLTVDDSYSMRSNPSIIYFTLNALNLVLSAVQDNDFQNHLECSLLAFGTDVQSIFSSEGGDWSLIHQCLAKFQFVQSSTNWSKLLSYIWDLYHNQIESINRDIEVIRPNFTPINLQLLNLVLVISDGLCQNHDKILNLVRRLEDSNIIIIVVIIEQNNYNTKGDGKSQSIMDLERVIIKEDGGIAVQNYMDTFPIKYLVCDDISKLPYLIMLLLSQSSSFFN